MPRLRAGVAQLSQRVELVRVGLDRIRREQSSLHLRHVLLMTDGLFDDELQPNVAAFAGSDYVPEIDDARLQGQILRVYNVMKDGRWRTINEIAAVTGDPPASILAQLGHLRKERFGSFQVDKRPRGDRKRGLWEYRLGGKGEGIPQRHPLAVRNEELDRLNIAWRRLGLEIVERHPNFCQELQEHGNCWNKIVELLRESRGLRHDHH